MKYVFLFRAAAVGIAALASTLASAATWFVSPCGQDAWIGTAPGCAAPFGPKQTIQAAINVASDGDFIQVLPGTYFEQIDFDGKAITIFAPGGPGVTTIDGNGVGPVVTCNSLEGPGSVLSGLTITGGATDQSGGGMLNALSSPTIINCVFEGNTAEVGGGAMANILASPTIVNTQFINNTAFSVGDDDSSGGAIHCLGGSLDLTGCDFTGNQAFPDGGAIAGFSGATITIEDCLFDGNQALNGPVASRGGAIVLVSSSADIANSTFNGNTSQFHGGAIVCETESDLTLTACDFTSNSVEIFGGGGALLAYSGTVSVFGCSFTGNSSVFEGGAITARGGVDLSVLFSGFTNNSSDGPGGAILAVFATVSISATTFTGNTSDADGGAVYVYNGTTDLSGSVFTNNTADDDGGGVFVRDNEVTMDNCTFNSNTADVDGDLAGHGGGVAIDNTDGSSVLITSCNFNGNNASAGGGLRGTAGNIDVHGAVFDANVASLGGGGVSASVDATLSIVDCQLVSNTANLGGGGGSFSGNATITRSNFSSNTAIFAAGAVVQTTLEEVVFVSCRFEGNTATNDSGAMKTTTGGTATLVNCLIEANTAPFGSGAIGVSGNTSEMTLIHCAIVGNSGGGVLNDTFTTGTSNILNSIVWGNTNGAALLGDASAVMYSNIEGGAPGAGNIDQDPLFVNEILGNFRLGPGSPSIDAGSNSLLPLDVADLDDDGDTLEILPLDLDADFRVKGPNDDCIDPVVDMGPYEATGFLFVILGDINGDGVVDTADLGILIGDFGICLDRCCPADLNNDGVVDTADLGILLANFGA